MPSDLEIEGFVDGMNDHIKFGMPNEYYIGVDRAYQKLQRLSHNSEYHRCFSKANSTGSKQTAAAQ